MVHFWRVVNQVLKDSDIILEVVDARFPEQSRNKEIEGKIRSAKKDLIVVFNKSDLMPIEKRAEPCDVKHYVYVSALNNLGTTKLREMIKSLARKKVTTIGVVGYPNTGKSSIINVLKQRKVARTSPTAGYTKGVQRVKLSRGFYLLDTPGVYEYKEKDEEKLAFIGAKQAEKLRDPEYIAMKILSQIPRELIEKIYRVEYAEDITELIERIAESLNYYKKGKKPDTDRAVKKIIKDWQSGVLKF